MTLLEVAKHALEAMEDAMYRADTHEFYDAKESLRYAIEQAEQAEQEPVAWLYPEGLEALRSGKPWTAYGGSGNGPHPDGVQRIPLYLNDAVALRVEPPAAESGAGFESLPASPNQPEQEPVALPEKMYEFVPTPEPSKWHHPECEGECIACLIERVVQEAYGSQGLGYLQRHLTSPPQRKPLTDEEINALWRTACIKPALTSELVRSFARAIEAAHGIGEQHD